MKKKNRSLKSESLKGPEFEVNKIAYQMLTGQLFDKHINIETEVTDIYHYIENILAQIPVSVYWMNKDFIYLGCTDSMAELLNLESRHAIVGKTYSDLYDKKSASHYKKADKMVIEQGINGDHKITRFGDRNDADAFAKNNKGKLYEYGQPLGNGDDHRIGKLIEDYSEQ